MTESPSTAGSNGRGPNGEFAPGNKLGTGNSFAKRVVRLRAALFQTVKLADLEEVVTALLTQAKAGDVASIKEPLQRLLGPPESIDLLERLDTREAQIVALRENKEKPWHP